MTDIDDQELFEWLPRWYHFLISSHQANPDIKLDGNYWEIVVCLHKGLIWKYGHGVDCFTRDQEGCEIKSQNRLAVSNMKKNYSSIQVVMSKDFGKLEQCKYLYLVIWRSHTEYNIYRVSAEEALNHPESGLKAKKARGSAKTSHHLSPNEIRQFKSFVKIHISIPEDDYDEPEGYDLFWSNRKLRWKLAKYLGFGTGVKKDVLEGLCSEHGLDSDGTNAEKRARLWEHLGGKNRAQVIAKLRKIEDI